MRKHGDITPLLPWLNEPYRKEEVLAAMRELQPPSLLREIAERADLPIYTVHRVLGRLVKQGVATRIKVRVAYTLTGGRGRLNRPGGKIRNVYAYTLVAPK